VSLLSYFKRTESGKEGRERRLMETIKDEEGGRKEENCDDDDDDDS
jgi:hypothetical protein